jgi:Kef-type K+ transport system membrane component KefB
MFFLLIAIMLVVGTLFGQILKKFKQPSIVGELIGGILLGPTILQYCSFWSSSFFSDIELTTSELNYFLQFGMILFMFISGLKINKSFLMERRRIVLFTSFFGMLIPLILGISVALWLPEVFNVPDGPYNILYIVFIGIALSISALPVIIKTLTDMDMIETELGNIIIGSAIIDDIMGWTMFICLVNTFVYNGQISDIFIFLLKLSFFILVIFTAGVKISKKIYNMFENCSTAIYISITIALLMVISTIAEKIGIHPFFAAFLFGIALKKEYDSRAALIETKTTLQAITTGFFAPLFFISVGMKVNLIKDFNLELVLIILFIAFLGKIAGSSIGAALSGIKWIDALVIGVGMNSRGAIEIIVASVAVDFGIIERQMYVALIIMAVITSLVGGPLIKILMKAPQNWIRKR